MAGVKLRRDERAALEYLSASRHHHHGKTASCVGSEVYDERRKGRIASASGGGDYAAQMLLGRMRRKGWVRAVPDLDSGATIWGVTELGRMMLALARSVVK